MVLSVFVEEEWYCFRQGGDLTIALMDDAGWVNMEEVQTITEEGIIKDHALRMCPTVGFTCCKHRRRRRRVGVYAQR